MRELEELIGKILQENIKEISDLIKNQILEETLHLIIVKISELTQKKELSGHIHLDAEKIKTECLKVMKGVKHAS